MLHSLLRAISQAGTTFFAVLPAAEDVTSEAVHAHQDRFIQRIAAGGTGQVSEKDRIACFFFEEAGGIGREHIEVSYFRRQKEKYILTKSNNRSIIQVINITERRGEAQ